MAKNIKTKLKASMLVVTLMIMGIILVSTLSIALVAVQERKASVGQNTSSQAYTTAENGIEIVMQLMKNNEGGKLSSIAGCANGVVTSTEGYTVKFKDAADEFITDCGAEIASVKTVKSIGTVGENQRAVEVAVAGSGDYQLSCLSFVANPASPYPAACCRIATKTGSVTCAANRFFMGGPAAWDTAVPQPSFPPVSAGDYQLNCFQSGGSQGQIGCCRTNTNSGNITCQANESFNFPSKPWVSVTPPSF